MNEDPMNLNPKAILEISNNLISEENVSTSLPVATILIIFIAVYVAVISLLVFMCKCYDPKIKFRDCCTKFLACSNCFECIKNCALTCDCRIPTANDCLDAICPARQRLNCIEFMICDWATFQCCQQGATCTCGSEDCSCTCEAPHCESINCLCCEISFKNVAVV